MAWRLSIDFGTSNTAAAIDVQGAVRPISLSESGTSMPSAIVLTPSGFRVGEEAVNAQLRHPDGFERSPKMLVGRGEVVLAGEIVSPNEIVREIYSHVRAAALRRQDGSSPAEVWLTHPVAWAPSQIESLREGAVAAGFAAETIRTVNEPIAAAAHYARNHRAAPGSRVAVFDFGGGTLDLAVLERAPQLAEGYRVLAYGGDPVLGGRTFDARLLDWALQTFARRGHSELADRLHRPKTMSELRAQTTLSRAVTAAKIELSTRPDADIAVSLGEEDAVVTITRKEYERLIADDLDRAGKLLTDVFAQVSGPAPEVLYLTGGSSRTPAISQMIRERTGVRIATLDDPKLVVAEGALHVAPLGAVRAAQPLKPSTPVPTQAPIPARPAQNPPPRENRPAPGLSQGAAAPFQPPSNVRSPQPQPQPFGIAATPSHAVPQRRNALPGSPQPKTPKKKSPMVLVLGIVAAVVIVGGAVWGAIALSNNASQANDGPTQTPYNEEVVVGDGPLDCWNGEEAAAGENCAALTGPEALDWLVTFDGASCEPVPGDESQKLCNWYDRPNSHVYVMEFASFDEAVGYGESEWASEPATWEMAGEEAGQHWEGEFTDGTGGYSHFYLYDDLPYGVFVRLDNDETNGTHDNLEDFENRFTMRPKSEVAHAVATTERV